MTRIDFDTNSIHIAAPDGPSAFALEARLGHMRPVTIGVDGDWTVELEDSEDRLDEVEAAVKHWLREHRFASTTMTVNGLPHTVVAGAEAAAPQLGSGYDGPDVLVHEP